MRPTILLPQDEQCDAGLLELDRKIGPVRFRASPRALFDAVATEELVLKRIVGQLPGKGQLNPTAAARCKLSFTVLRAIPNTTAISRELVPLPASRSICLNCLMISLLFAGIKMSPFIAR